MSADPSVTATLPRQLHDGSHAPASSQPFSPLPPPPPVAHHQQSQLALTPEPEASPGPSTSSGSTAGLVPSSFVPPAPMATTTTTSTTTPTTTSSSSSGSVHNSQPRHAPALRPLPVPPDNQSMKLAATPSSSSAATTTTPSSTPAEPQSAEIPASLQPRLNPTAATDPLSASYSFASSGPGSVVPSPHSAVGSQTQTQTQPQTQPHTPASSSRSPPPPPSATQSSPPQPSPSSSSSSLSSSSTRPSQDQGHGQDKGQLLQQQQQQQLQLQQRHRNEAVLTSVAPRSSSLPLSSAPLAAMGNSGSSATASASKPLPPPPSESPPHSSSSSSQSHSQSHPPSQARTRANASQQLPYLQASHSTTHQRQLSASPPSIAHSFVSTGTGTSSSTGKAKGLLSRAFGGRWKKNEDRERSLTLPRVQEMPSSGSAPSKLASHMFGPGKKLNLGSKGAVPAPPTPPKSTGMDITPVSDASLASDMNTGMWSRSGTYPIPSTLSTSTTSPFSSAPSQSQSQKQTQLSTPTPAQGNRSSIIPLSPGIESAVNFMKRSEEEKKEGLPLPPPPMPSASSLSMTSSSALPSVVPLVPVRREDVGNVNVVKRKEEGESAKALEEREKEKERTQRNEQLAQPTNEWSGEAEKERGEEEAEADEWIGSIPAARPRPRRPLSESLDNMTPFGSPSDKRKSDSTISHCTVRAGGIGAWSSRPVSMAESFQSTYTIVPMALSSPNGSGSGSALVLVDKRLSSPEGVIDFGAGMSVPVVQEESEREEGKESITKSVPSKQGEVKKEEVKGEERPPTTIRPLKRRSMSLNVNIGAGSSSPTSGGKGLPANAHLTGTELKHPSYSISEGIGFGYGMTQPATPERNALARLKAAARNHKLPALPLDPNASTGNASVPSTPNALQTFVYPSRKHPSPAQPPIANPHLSSYSNHPNQQHHTTFRQTAVSITSSLAPAAVMAKKAVEKFRGAWTLGHGHGSGSMSTSTSSASISSMTGMGSGSGYGSSTSASNSYSGSMSVGAEGLSAAPSAYMFPTEWGVGGGLRKAGSKEGFLNASSSGLTPGGSKKKEREEKKKRRRTPNAPGGVARSYAGSLASLSVSTCASTNDSMDGSFGTGIGGSGPILGTLLREPIVGQGSSIVFGRDLERCVRETGIWVRRSHNDEYGEGGEESGLLNRRPDLKAFEERMLPAVVVRCAQHLLIWGVQEEGLFRVPGRAAHIMRLRNEFDTGADYDMSACSPGDLDPHAVASLFKAYLRELPEHILTQKLQPYFDIAIEQDSAASAPTDVPATSETDSTTSKFGMRSAFGLPTSQRPHPLTSANGFTSSNLRKPPSLSTLAMPSFNGMHPPSRGLLNALRSLIGRLPQENKDLLRTVVDLIRATAKEAKATKMPLSNLLMVFLPSLNVSAQLLKVLCEEEGIWEGCGVYGVEGEVTDVRRDTVVLDTKGDKGVVEETAERNDRNSPQERFAETDDEEDDEIDAQRRWTIVDRPQVPTIYLDSRSHYSSSITNSSRTSISLDHVASADSSMTRDTDGISISDDGNFQSFTGDADHPQLSSSVESVPTPMTSSGQPSLAYLPLPLNNAKNFSEKEVQEFGGQPMVVESTTLGLESGAESLGGSRTKRFIISNPRPIIATDSPMQSPVKTKESQSNTPAPTGKQKSTSPKRRSIPSLSFPNISFVSGSANAEPESALETRSLASEGGNLNGKGLKTKKPSLRLLFSKHSTDSLKGSNGGSDKSSILSRSPGRPFISAPFPASNTGPFALSVSPSSPYGMTSASPEIRSPSDSSVSTPLSAFTASMNGSVMELPPLLDTAIEEGPSLSAELGLDVSPTSEKHDVEAKQERRKERIKTLVGKTPIADWYKNASVSSFSDLPAMPDVTVSKDDGRDENGEFAASTLRSVPGRSKGKSTAIPTSNFVSIGDEEFGAPEDWTRTVLLAADMEFESREW